VVDGVDDVYQARSAGPPPPQSARGPNTAPLTQSRWGARSASTPDAPPSTNGSGKPHDDRREPERKQESPKIASGPLPLAQRLAPSRQGDAAPAPAPAPAPALEPATGTLTSRAVVSDGTAEKRARLREEARETEEKLRKIKEEEERLEREEEAAKSSARTVDDQKAVLERQRPEREAAMKSRDQGNGQVGSEGKAMYPPRIPSNGVEPQRNMYPPRLPRIDPRDRPPPPATGRPFNRSSVSDRPTLSTPHCFSD
jgi:hypothetical protein